MRLHDKIHTACLSLIVTIYAGICSGQPTHVPRHCGLLDESSKVALLNKIDRTLHDTTAAAAVTTAEIAAKIDHQRATSAITQSDVQQLSRIVGQILTANISDLSAATARSAGGLEQAIQMLTEISTRMSTRIEELHDIFNITLRKAEATSRAYESHVLSDLDAALKGAFALQNETRQCTRTDQLLSKYNESIAILQSLPEVLQSVLVTTYENASANLFNHSLRSFSGCDVLFNRSQSSVRELSVNYTLSVGNILTQVNRTADNCFQHREQMSNVSLQNQRLLNKVEHIFFAIENVSETMQDIRETSPEYVCSPYDKALRTARNRTAHTSQQWTKTVAEMQVFSEYLSPATSGIVQGSRTYAGCQDAFRQGMRRSDVHNINVSAAQPFRAWCDFDSQGGWMVMQRRFDGTVDFFKSWEEYGKGFGNLWGEHWLGLEKVQLLTRYAVRLSIYMEAFDSRTAWANYSIFRVSDVHLNYGLTIGGFSGNAGDSLSPHNGSPFSTRDRDNDAAVSGSCARSYFGAWWYTSCHQSHLNAQYERGATGDEFMYWHAFNNKSSLKTTVMRMLV